ncbi:MAG TPA: VOC family protein [Caulobacteraceae bacterium]
MAAPATIAGVSPFFIVGDVSLSVAFYRERLGFQVTYQEPAADPFFAIVARDAAQLFLKHLGPATPALPNPRRHPDAKWDAYFHVADPDGLAAEYAASATPFAAGLGDTSDGLRGFEIADPDGHVLFFGRPIGAT